MAKSPNADSISAGFSTAPSTACSNLDSPISFNPSEPSGEGRGDTPPTVGYNGYEGIDWSRLPGYFMRKHGRGVRTGWVWEHGYDIEKVGSGRRSRLCKECHRKRATTTHIYDSASTSQANSHIESVHRINKDGQLPLKRKNNARFLTWQTWTLIGRRTRL
jgi:hypothetical protein